MAILKPEALTIGTKFRFVRDACNEDERNDHNLYEVVNINDACRIGVHVVVKNESGEMQEMQIMPWVKLIGVEGV